MSNALAFAAVTACVQQLLSQSLEAAKTSGIVSGQGKVTAQPPDRIVTDNPNDVRLNLFLYEVSPNAGWANEGLPSRGADGQRTSNPRLALDLTYLLSAHGAEDLEAEIVLGHAMQALHETPGLSRASIRKLLDPAPLDAVGVLRRAFRAEAVKLAEQIEWIKITPRYLKSDDMSKIWSSLQTHYRPSVAYQATVVLIERRQAVETVPPVLKRGADDRGPSVLSDLLPPFPTLLGLRLPGQQTAVRADGQIELFGHHLEGVNLTVQFRNSRRDLRFVAQGPALTIGRPDWTSSELPPDDVLRFADTRIRVDLSQTAPVTDWAAGGYSVEVQLVSESQAAARTTNSLPLAIAPSFQTSGPNAPQVVITDNVVGVTLTCSPPLRPRQVASLILGSQELPGLEITEPTDTLRFQGRLPAAMLTSGSSHGARLRVDGVDSLYIRRFPKPKPPEFDPTQRITIP